MAAAIADALPTNRLAVTAIESAHAARRADMAEACHDLGDTDRMLGPVRVSRSVTIPEGDLRWRFSRSSGPGGQSVNTTDSRVELSVDLKTATGIGPVLRARALERLAGRLVDGVLTVTASEERSQLRNREIAHKRLRDTLAAAVAPPSPRRRPTKASRAAVERRLADKKRRAKTKRLRRSDED
jgi:ribosome-associated protein